MSDENIELVLVFSENQVLPLVRGTEHSLSYFGGPLEQEVAGATFGPRPLHHVANLSHHHIPALAPPNYIFDLPLVYGLQYSGCTMRYRYEHGTIEMLSIDPSSSEESWPYKGYPELLPFVPLKLGQLRASTWTEFAQEFPNMDDEQPADLVVVIPPPMTLGVSLWGRYGDAEGVSIVFECNLKSKEVNAYNICS